MSTKVKRIINQFDSVFTFERDDAEKWGVTFLPLFYSPRFDNKHEHSLKYDLCFIGEAMKLMNEIESEYDGVVEAVLVNNEDVVEYGQPLFRIK